jgi:hypothetical protein
MRSWSFQTQRPPNADSGREVCTDPAHGSPVYQLKSCGSTEPGWKGHSRSSTRKRAQAGHFRVDFRVGSATQQRSGRPGRYLSRRQSRQHRSVFDRHRHFAQRIFPATCSEVRSSQAIANRSVLSRTPGERPWFLGLRWVGLLKQRVPNPVLSETVRRGALCDLESRARSRARKQRLAAIRPKVSEMSRAYFRWLVLEGQSYLLRDRHRDTLCSDRQRRSSSVERRYRAGCFVGSDGERRQNIESLSVGGSIRVITSSRTTARAWRPPVGRASRRLASGCRW